MKTICALAACALESLELGQEWPAASAQGFPLRTLADDEGTIDASESVCGAHYPRVLHDATFLNAILPYAIGQALRHREPLSLMCVAIDRFSGIRQLLGRDAVDDLVRFVGATVVSSVRASDIVARLDDDRVMAILPRSDDEGALRIGEAIRRKVVERRWARSELPGMQITVSIGAATFPSSAGNVLALFEAADAALAQAQAQGGKQTVIAPRIPDKPREPATVGQATREGAAT